MSEWQKCPVCNGAGKVTSGFYNRGGDWPFWVSSDGNPEMCRCCQGKGIILKPIESPEVTVTYFTVPISTG
jgi:DnaJ-class molecular chaperone